jgi:hypothetical protein
MDYIYTVTEVDDNLLSYISKTMSVLYEAREGVFGGVFPFPFEKAMKCFATYQTRRNIGFRQ